MAKTTCTTQGTVQVECEADQLKIFVNPISDYAIKHQKKDYTVFVAEDLSHSLVCERETCFTSDDEEIKKILIEAAGLRTKVELKVESPRRKIVAIKIPASTL